MVDTCGSGMVLDLVLDFVSDAVDCICFVVSVWSPWCETSIGASFFGSVTKECDYVDWSGASCIFSCEVACTSV